MKRYNFTDLIKLLLALLLVVAHCASEIAHFPVMVDLFFSLYIIVVPFFLCVSSFFLFKKIFRTENYCERVSIYRAYSLRVWGLYAVWSGIYMCLHILSWCRWGVSSEEVAHYFHGVFVYSAYPTIWFLPALWVAVSCVFVLHVKYKLSLKKVLVVSVILYLIGVVGYTYADYFPLPWKRIPEIYESVFLTWRNGLFNGFVFCTLGAILASREPECFSWGDLLWCALLGVGFIGEAFVTKRIAPASDANFLVLMMPFTYNFVKLSNRISLKHSPVYRVFRSLSSSIFLSQRLFITAIPALLPGSVMAGIMINPYAGTIIVLACTLIFSLLLLWASARWSILKSMY